MEYADNCPMVLEYYDPHQPITHSRPVHHPSGVPLGDWDPACLWAQLQWERERNDDGSRYLQNLESEWSHRNLCSRCLRELDHPFMTEVGALQQRAATAEGKIGRIVAVAAQLDDRGFRLAVADILADDLPETPAAG
jgi:hypothetical protein